jgi:alpha-beta hydrolase superfamily lysophospholipase
MDSAKRTASDGTTIHFYRWLPDGDATAAIQIAHGMGEHAARYHDLARRLNAQGYAVYANDHRGHGRTAGKAQLGNLGPNGWNAVIQDVLEQNAQMAAQHPGLPRILLGHSMGAMIIAQFIARHGDTVDAVVISGTPGFSSPLQLLISHTIARLERLRLGSEANSEIMAQAIFGDANKSFDATNASGFEWLSRDAEQVRRYVDDELCGFVLRVGSLCDMLAGMREARRPKTVAAIPRDLPIYVFSGADDPVHGQQKGLQRLLSAYQSQVLQLEYKLYPNGRHEMLNELNQDEVSNDLLDWLERTLRCLQL